MQLIRNYSLIEVICYSRLHGNILSTGQCITIHQYNNKIIKELSIDIWKKINFTVDKMESQKWHQPGIMFDGDKNMMIREYGEINYKPFKPFLK